MKPQNQVTVRSSETDLVFRINRTVAEKHDTLTILDEIGEWDEIGGLLDADADQESGWDVIPIATPVQSADKPADPIAAPVADDN